MKTIIAILLATTLLAGCPPTTDPATPHSDLRYHVWWSPSPIFYQQFATNQITHLPDGSISFHAEWVRFNSNMPNTKDALITLRDNFAIADLSTNQPPEK